jgi:hypothetical protein
MHPTHRTPDGRLWFLLTMKGATYAELWGAVGNKRTRTTDLSDMEPLCPEPSANAPAAPPPDTKNPTATSRKDGGPTSQTTSVPAATPNGSEQP